MKTRKAEHGQAMIEMALMLPLIVGLLALIIDLGLGQWRHMTCTSAAQSAAMGAAVDALEAIDLDCRSGLNCQTLTCPEKATITPYNNLMTGCVHAAVSAMDFYKSSAVISSGNGLSPAGVSHPYWVSATVREKVPAIFGWGLNISVRSTAAVWVHGPVRGVFLVE